MNTKVESAVQEIRAIGNDFLAYVQETISEQYGQCQNLIANQVLSLLDVSKPKIMMYGIYNAGKSTLVNALMGQEVASVADKPETSKIKEYDTGDYILIDSPGIDAPIEHEKITKNYLANCHIIFFLVSNKGTFESKKNYEEMYQVIKDNRHFIIIINDKQGVPGNENDETIRELKNKIINNLSRVSGESSYQLQDKYDIIFVNAQRALSDKPVLVARSNIDKLKNKIQDILQKEDAFKRLEAPINNFLNLIQALGLHQASCLEEYSDASYQLQMKNIYEKRNNLLSTLKINIRGEIYAHENSLVNAYLSGDGVNSTKRIEENIGKRIDSIYQEKLREIAEYVQSNFAELGIEITADCNEIHFTKKELLGKELVLPNNLENRTNSPNISSPAVFTNNADESDSSGLGDIALGLGTVLTGFTKFTPAGIPILVIGVASKLIDVVSGLFERKEKKERELFERLLLESQEMNRKAEEAALEQARVRQQLRSEVQNRLFEIQNNILGAMTQELGQRFDLIVEALNAAIGENSEAREQIQANLQKLSQMRRRLEAVKNVLC